MSLQSGSTFYPKTILGNIVLPGLKKKLSSPSAASRAEAVTLFGQIAQLFPYLYPDLSALIAAEYPFIFQLFC